MSSGNLSAEFEAPDWDGEHTRPACRIRRLAGFIFTNPFLGARAQESRGVRGVNNREAGFGCGGPPKPTRQRRVLPHSGLRTEFSMKQFAFDGVYWEVRFASA
jgi:hypothetical protein